MTASPSSFRGLGLTLLVGLTTLLVARPWRPLHHHRPMTR